MKILFVHNSYQHAGGEDAVLQAEMGLLVDNAQECELANRDNHSIKSILAKMNAFKDVVYSKPSKRWMTERLKLYRPDVMHVHNFFPLLSPSIYDACIEAAVPVIQTLHNYRTICPGALLMRNGKVCEDCVTGSAYQAVTHRCYRGSMIGTYAVARMVNHHRNNATWQEKVTQFVALTSFAKSKFVEAGFPKQKITIKPNFVLDPLESIECASRQNKALFVGRISLEKGADIMLRAWGGVKAPLAIAGDGPELIKLKNEHNNIDVCFLGNQSKKQIHELMSTFGFLVMPSVWYEGFPMVLVEAFAHGLPVLASRLGGMAEIVEDGVTGIHFEAGNADDLAEKAQWMFDHPDECRRMGENARQEYLAKYTPERNYETLMKIYEDAIEDQKCSKN